MYIYMYSLIYIISYILLRVKFSRSLNFKMYIYMYIPTYMYMAKPDLHFAFVAPVITEAAVRAV